MAGDRTSLGKLYQQFTALPIGVRVTAIGAGALCAAVLIAWSLGAMGEGGYSPLFTDLEPVDASDILTALDADKVPYKLAGDGRTILVPESVVHRVRLQLAGQGLPQGGIVGFELLDRSKLGSTEFERRMSYLRALQGELTRTITQIDGVDQARVHIVMPEQSLFVSERREPTAGVLLQMRPGFTLDPDRVSGITHLVSRSVEGLAPDNVTVVDTFGRILSARDSSTGTPGISLSQLDTQSTFERELENRLTSLLSQVFGPQNALAQVNAQLNFDQRVVETSMFIPAEDRDGLVRTIREVEEQFSGDGGTPGGVPGTASNVSDVPVYQAVSGSGASEYERREVTKEHELGRTYEHQVIAPGSVERLTVSVVINETLTAAQQQLVQDMVAAAIGYDEQRRDNITITGIEFDTTLVDELRLSMAADAQAHEAASKRQMFIMIGAALLVVMIVVFALRNRQKRAADGELEALQLSEKKHDPERKAEDEASAKAFRDVERLIKQRPETVATLVRAWLAEE